MAFNPDEYLAKTNSAFDPDAYLSKSQAPAESAEGDARAFLEHYGNTATLGYLPHLQAMTTKLMPNPNADLDAKLEAEGFKINAPEESYTDLRDENIERLQRMSKEHPKSAGAGAVSGIAATALMTGAALPAAQAATLPARLLQAGKTGAVLGAAANPGDIKGEISPIQLEDRAANAGIGALTGVAAQGLGEGVAKAGQASAQWLRSKANEKAFKATGAMLRDFRKAFGRDKIDDIGREALDDGTVSWLATPADVAERSGANLQAKGKEIEGILSELDNAQHALNGGGEAGIVPHGVKAQGRVRSGVDRNAIAKSLREDLISENVDIPGIVAKNKKISKLISAFENGEDDMLGLLESELKKRSVGKEINWNRLPDADIPVEEQVQRALYSKLRQGVEDGAEALEGMVGGPSVGRFKAAKNSYGNKETINKISTDRVNRDAANRAFGLTDTIAASGGLALGDSPEEKAAYGVLLGLINKGGRTYGNAIQAKSFDALSKMAFKSPALVAAIQKNPAAFQTMMEGSVSKMRGGPDYGSGEEHPLFKNPKTVQMLKDNPALIESIQDEKLKQIIRKRLGRGPAESKSAVPATHVDNPGLSEALPYQGFSRGAKPNAPSQKLESQESAQKRFLEES
jgi:hypothetical protein